MKHRRGWVKAGGERLALVVTDRRFNEHNMVVRMRDTLFVQECCCEGKLVDELEKELGHEIDLVGWID